MKKFIIALATVFVLCVPAFADNEVYFAPSPFTFSNPSGYLNITATSANPSVPCYYFLRYSNSGNTELRVFAITATQGAAVNYSGVTSDGTSNTSNNNKCNLAAGDYFVGALYFVGGTDLQNLVTTDNLSIFPYNTDMSVIGSAFADYLANPPTPSPAGNAVTIHVPYGNVLYIKVAQRQDNVQLVAHMPKLSFLIPDSNYGYWGETGICWGDYNTLPYSGLTFPLQGMSGIDWHRDSSRNILGQTKTGVATKIMNTGVWYALFCPSLFGHFDLDSSSAMPGASVDVTGVFSDIRLYPLSDSYSFVDNEVVNGSDSEFQDYLEGESTESGAVTWTDQDGNVAVPRAGGSSYVPEAETAESLISQIKNILGNIVKELQTLFTFGYDAIQTLVNLMSDFVSGFSQLYTWLPAPVYSVIISAVTIAIVIGVFKVFL